MIFFDKRSRLKPMTGRNMKKIIPAALILFFLFLPIPRAGTIIGSPHDFRKMSWERSGEICLPCHVPHKIETLPDPLWDHALSTQTFVMYSRTRSPGRETPADGRPDGISKKCLSCHDGIIASDTFSGNTGGDAYRFEGNFTGMPPNNSHPVSFIYDTALAFKDGDLYDPSTRPSGLAGSNAAIDADMLFSNRMECASCHDVHNAKAVPETKLLVIDTTGSTLCLTCHDK